ncbi:MAG: T9SS type A sorting domain-containing protein [Candidatus Latescibacteria bacterium]|nr:T9SS type A sorting domain-containing protein [Candidatus Latescibacterota bacterium]
MNGNPTKGSALLRVASGITNAGTLRLESSGGAQASSILLTGGTLVNTGLLEVNTGSGGQRLITADLSNQGQVQISAPLTFNKANGIYLNTGSWVIAAGQILTITSGNQSFNQNSGILQADGELSLRSATFGFNGGAIQGSGAVLTAAALNIGPAAGAGLLTLRGTCTLNGNVSAAQTLWVNGSPTGGTGYLRATTGFTNAGTIRLQSTGGVYASNILLTSGALVNTGTIEVNAGTGGQRQLTADLNNQGTLAINTPTVFTKPSGVYTNSGSLNIASGQSLSIASSSQIFSQNGGTLDAQGELRLTAVPFNYSGGEVTGSGLVFTSSTLNLGSLSGAGTFTLRGACNLSGNVAGNQVLLVKGSAAGGHAVLRMGSNVTNEGLIRFESSDGSYTANLSATTPTATLTNKGVVEVNPGSGGQRLISADLDNQGALSFNASTLLNKTNGKYTNRATMSIAAGRTLTINGGNQVFSQNEGTLAIDGAFQGSGISFSFNGGASTGNQPVLKAAALTLGPASGAVNLVLQGASVLKSDIRPDQVLWVNGSQAGVNATLRADAGFSNAGTIRLESTEGLYTANLLVSAGALVNTGLIAVNAGSGGQRLIMANLDNQGRVEVNTPATFSKSGGVYTNAGEFIVGPGGSLGISGGLQVFNQNDGVLQAAGEMKLMGMTFNFNGGAIEGSGLMPTSITLNIGPAAGGAAFTLRGSCLLGGNVGLGQVLWVNGNPVGGAALLRTLSGFTNRGTIRLESSGGVLASNLVVASGVLTNQGRIEVNAGSGGQRLITADLDNQGVFRNNAQLQLSKTNGVYTNSDGEFRVEAGQLLTIAGGSQVFNQNGGDLVVDGDMNLSTMTFNINGGAVPSKAPLLYNCALNFGSSGAAAGVANLKVRGRCSLIGNVASGQTIWVNGTTATDAVLTAANGLTNRGLIRLESSESPVASNLVVTNGTLVNEGTIAANKGSGGGRSILTNLDNQGLLDINTRAVLSKSANGVFANSGNIDIVPRDTLTISVGSFTNTEAGRVSGGGELVFSRINLAGTGIIAANVQSHQTSFNPGLGGAGMLRIEGSYLQSPTSELNIQLGGLTPGTEHDQLQVTGSVALDGKLRISAINGYQPNPCDAFAVFTYGSQVVHAVEDGDDDHGGYRSGQFTPVEGLNLGGDRVLRANYRATGLDLLARAPSAKVNIIPTSLAAAESGGGQPYRVCLSEQPNAAVRVAPAPDLQVAVTPPELTFAAAAWGAVQDFAVSAIDDPVYEGAHQGTITHAVSSGDARFNGAPVGRVEVQIEDNDAQPTLSVADLALDEGNTGNTVASFVVSLSNPSAVAVQADFTTTDGSAQAGSDYLAGSGVVTFAPLETSKSFDVLVQGERVYEGDENLLVDLHNAVNGTIADGQGVGTIRNDDAQPSLSIGDVSVAEGNGGAAVVSFPVTLSNPSSQTLSVEYLTTDGSAQAGSDYVGDAGSLSFDPLETSKMVSVVVQGEQVYENDETFLVNLHDAVNGTLADGQGVGTIVNDDALPTLDLADVLVAEGNSGATEATFTVTLSNPSSQSLSVGYTTADGSAQAPADYVAGSGVVAFAPLELSKTFSVPVVGDLVYEADETFAVDLRDPVNGVLGKTRGIATISNDDEVPVLAIGDVSVTEGDAGTVAAAFILTLSTPSSQPVQVAYATADGSAGAPADYTAASGTVEFAPLETSKILSVPVVGDLLNEAGETFVVNLSTPVNTTLADAQGVATIADNDPQPVLTIADLVVSEGNGGATMASFTVNLSAPSGRLVSVGYATADGSAQAPADYLAASGTVQFAPSETSRTIAIQINGDLLDEPDEGLVLNLTNAVNAGFGDSQALLTIADDDAPPALGIADVAVAEGNSGTKQLVFTVSLSAPSGRQVSVGYTTADGSAQTPSDYLVASGTLVFAPLETSKTLAVQINGDLLDEADETLVANLDLPVNATLADGQGIGTIADDDLPPALSASDASELEGDSGTKQLVFTVSLSAPSGRAVSVNWATANGTALAGSDYTAASGTLSFAAGEASKTVAVLITGEVANEPNETVLLNLSAPVNAVLGDGQGTGTIVNDDAPPALSVNDLAVVEGNSGTKQLVFTVSMSFPGGRVASVNWATANGTALAGSDYTAASGTLSFAVGETSKTLSVTLKGDLANEPNETFLVNLSNPVNAVLADGQGIGTILTDDHAPEVSLAAPSATYLWPANHKLVNIQILGLTDVDGDSLRVLITKITQDESVYGSGSGKKTGPDGAGIGTAVAQVRAEREGNGNGRVYEISFTVSDGHEGGLVAGRVKVGVPHDQGGDECVDDGQRYNSVTGGLEGAAAKVAADLSGGDEGFGVGNYPNPFNPSTTIVYTLAEEAAVRLAVYNMLGQLVKVLVEEVQAPGSYDMEWDSTDELGDQVGAGIYFYRLEAGPRVATGKMLLAR